MFRFIVLASCIVALASARVAKQKVKNVVDEPEAQGTHIGEVRSVGLADHGSNGLGGHGSGKSYASGAELTSLAHTPALQAKSAVQSQGTAGSQAAFGAKSSLAKAHLGAAATAQSNLLGKQLMVQGLEHQLEDAERQL